MPRRTSILMLTVLMIPFFSAISLYAKSTGGGTPSEISQFRGMVKSFTIQNQENLTIFSQIWLPPTEIKAVVLFMHGTATHSGAYDHVGKYMASNGYVVYGVDLQGWGQSQGKRRNGYINSYDDYTLDIEILLKGIRNKYPDKKIFAAGENMGAIVSLYGQIKNELGFDGFIISGTFHKPNPKVIFRMPEFAASLVRRAGIIGSSFSFVKKMPVVPTFIVTSMSLSDKEAKKDLKRDPYVTHKFLPVSWANAVLSADRYIDERLHKIYQPTLILHGDKDKVIPVRSSEDILSKIASNNKELKVFPGSGNTVLLDGAKFEALENICSWLDARCMKRG